MEMEEQSDQYITAIQATRLGQKLVELGVSILGGNYDESICQIDAIHGGVQRVSDRLDALKKGVPFSI